MAITINGTGSITGLTAGGLPDGSVVAADLASSLDLTGKTVTLPSGTGGKVIGTKFQWMEATNTSTPSSNTWYNTGVVFTYTPVSSSSVLSISLTGTMGTTNNGVVRLLAGSTNVLDATPVGSTSLGYGDMYAQNDSWGWRNRNLNWHYAPGTSGSAITFTLQGLSTGTNNTFRLGRMTTTSNVYNITSGVQLTILECAGTRSELT